MKESETGGFMRSLCMGRIDDALLLPFPVVSGEERDTLPVILESVKKLLEPHRKDFQTWDREGELPEAFLNELKEFGLFGLIVPEAHGGMGLSNLSYARVLEEVARYDASLAVTLGAHSSIGLKGVLLFGTEAQQRAYLPRLATGELVAAFCLTEAEAGSDAAGLRTEAERVDGGWLLRGQKQWITNGGIAGFFTVFAKTGAVGGRGGITAFLVPRSLEGVSVGPHEDKMGLRSSSTTTVHFDDVRLGDEHVLGEVGKGFKVAMTILNNGRTGLGGGCIGSMRALIELSAKHANERKQFGRPIGDFGLVQQKLGHMLVDCYAAESVVAAVAGMIDGRTDDYAIEAAISKVFATEALFRTSDEALQIAGGTGYMTEYPYERIARDVRIYRIFEGTNEILRLFIALTAMNEVSHQLKDVAEGLRDVFRHPIKGFGVLGEYAARRTSLMSGLGSAAADFGNINPLLRSEAAAFEVMTRDLALAVDGVLRKHGKEIIGRQFASRRLADMMIDLFVFASTLARVSSAIETKGDAGTEKEREILEVLTGQVRQRIRRNITKIDDNDDALIKSLARHAREQERYVWDVI